MPPTSCTPEVRGTSARLTSPHAPNLVHPGGSGHQRTADEPPCPQPPTGPTETGVSAPGTARAPAAPLVSADPRRVGKAPRSAARLGRFVGSLMSWQERAARYPLPPTPP